MMECLLCLILQLLSLRKAAAQTYTHTTYARQLNTITPLQPTLLGTIETKTVSECGQICHYSSTCSSFLFNGTHCVTFEGTMYFDEGGQREEYFILSNRLVHSDISGTFAAECTSHGYLYDPLVPLCYKVNDTGLAKADAMASCEQSNGHLLRINTYRKQLLVESLNLHATGSISKYRIDGEKNSNGIWTFSDGRKITTFYWYPGEPRDNLKSIALRVTYEGKWDDVKETRPHGFICERTFSLIT